jgi:hypothetical protein
LTERRGIGRGTALVAISLAAFASIAVAAAPSWRLEPLPEPAGASASSLTGIACVSTVACTAVGHYTDAGDNDAMFVDRLSSRSWHVQTLASPVGATSALLYGLGCSSSRACTAVGTANITGKASPALAERWNGAAWKREAVPVPKTSIGTALLGVACPSSNRCIAVGYYMMLGGQPDTLGPEVILAEVWDGTSWNLQRPGRPSGDTFSQFLGVSCTSTRACTAVGYYNADGAEHPLAERWDGRTWKVQTVPLPAGAHGGALNGVSCSSASVCVSVGGDQNVSNHEVAFAARWNGTVWKAQAAPSPGTASVAELNSIACQSTVSCEAVGAYAKSAGDNRALVERWSGAWTIQKSPVTGAPAEDLAGIACPSSALCEAVGEEDSTSGPYIPLGERYS